MPKPKTKQKTSPTGQSRKKAARKKSFLARCRILVVQLWAWLLGRGPRRVDPVLRSLRFVQRYGAGGVVPEKDWLQLEQQARSLAKNGQNQQALTILHCLLLLRPGSTAVLEQVEQLTARHHKLSLNSKGISGTTRVYRKQELDLYVQQQASQVLEIVSSL